MHHNEVVIAAVRMLEQAIEQIAFIVEANNKGNLRHSVEVS